MCGGTKKKQFIPEQKKRKKAKQMKGELIFQIKIEVFLLNCLSVYLYCYENAITAC